MTGWRSCLSSQAQACHATRRLRQHPFVGLKQLHQPLDVHPTLQLALPLELSPRLRRRLGRRQVGSPDARRSGRKSSGLSLERCSSRSRSPGVCERLARSETSLLSGVIWDYHVGILNPDMELIANHARAAIRSWTRWTEADPPLFYVGVCRYLRRRWLGGVI